MNSTLVLEGFQLPSVPLGWSGLRHRQAGSFHPPTCHFRFPLLDGGGRFLIQRAGAGRVAALCREPEYPDCLSCPTPADREQVADGDLLADFWLDRRAGCAGFRIRLRAILKVKVDLASLYG